MSDSLRGGDLVELALRAQRAGVSTFQVREKHLGDADLYRLVSRIAAALAHGAMRLAVNSRPDIAVLCGAALVQLPEEGLPVAAVRHAFPGLGIGASRHSFEGALRAEEEGADFVVLGPIFETPGKEGRALGLEILRKTAASLRIPVHAIGGIDSRTGPQALAAGAQGVCAIRAFLGASMEEAVRTLRGEG